MPSSVRNLALSSDNSFAAVIGNLCMNQSLHLFLPTIIVKEMIHSPEQALCILEENDILSASSAKFLLEYVENCTNSDDLFLVNMSEEELIGKKSLIECHKAFTPQYPIEAISVVEMYREKGAEYPGKRFIEWGTNKLSSGTKHVTFLPLPFPDNDSNETNRGFDMISNQMNNMEGDLNLPNVIDTDLPATLKSLTETLKKCNHEISGNHL